jgi:hypothetical protein
VVLNLAAWGHGHDEFLDADLKTRLRADMIEGIESNNVWSQGRGGSSMSHGYYGEHYFREDSSVSLVVHGTEPRRCAATTPRRSGFIGGDRRSTKPSGGQPRLLLPKW